MANEETWQEALQRGNEAAAELNARAAEAAAAAEKKKAPAPAPAPKAPTPPAPPAPAAPAAMQAAFELRPPAALARWAAVILGGAALGVGVALMVPKR